MIEKVKYREQATPRAGALRSTLAIVVLVGVGIVLGSVAARPSTAWGEVRTRSVPQGLQSGGQLSLPVLEDIASTLRQIDSRLARLEQFAKELQTKRALSPKP